jgi:hypothetical protein
MAEEEDTVEAVADRIGTEVSEEFSSSLREGQALVVLLAVKQFLQRVNGFTEA